MEQLLPAFPLFFLGYGAYRSWNNHHANLINQIPGTIEQLSLVQQLFSQGVFNCAIGIAWSLTGGAFLGAAVLSAFSTAISHNPSKKTLIKMGLFGLTATAIGATSLAYGCTNIGEGSLDVFQSLNASRG